MNKAYLIGRLASDPELRTTQSGRQMARVKAALRASGRDVRMVENCGLPGERVFADVDDIPDDAGYFSLIIAREAL